MRKNRRRSNISRREEQKAQKLIRNMCVVLFILAILFIALYIFAI